jgi:hypothetical protein
MWGPRAVLLATSTVGGHEREQDEAGRGDRRDGYGLGRSYGV